METDWLFLLLDFGCHCLDHRNRRWWKKVKTRPLPSMSSEDDITTTSNMEMPFRQIARPSKYNSWPLQTRYILGTVTRCTLYIPLAKGRANSNHKCQPQVRKGLKKPPLSLTQKSNPERITLKGCAHLLPGWLSFSFIGPDIHPTVLSREHTRWGQDSHVLSVSRSPTVRNIKALAPSLLVPNFCPGEGCHLLTHHLETATYIHWDLLLKLKSDSQEPTSLGKCSNLRDKRLPPWLTNNNN